jgi:hypothetical protein
MRRLLIASFMALLAATSASAQGGRTYPYGLTAPEGSGPVLLAIIERGRGYPNGDSWCPPDTNWETDICLGASIVIARGRIVRILGASENVDPKWRSRKFKAIGGHAIRYMEGGRALAVIEQTDQDYYYVQWTTETKNNRFCLPQSMIDHYKLATDMRFAENKDGEHCYKL